MALLLSDYCPTITWKITTDWGCVKTDVPRMIHEGNKGDWFTYNLWQTYQCKKCCKQQYSKQALSWYNFNPKGIIIFPHDDKQIVLLTSMGNNNH